MMVLGISRARPRAVTVEPDADRRVGRQTTVRRWVSERGEILFDAPCEVIGGFPGFADHGGRLELARFRVTERYLLVEDGDPRGFGLPVRWIDGVALVAMPGNEDQALQVHYRDGASPRLFTVRFRGHRLPMRSFRRAEHAAAALVAAGLRERQVAPNRRLPDLTIPWELTGSLETETTLWSGRVTAPRLVGLDGVAGDAWLTTRSLIWGSDDVSGVNRIPLEWLTDVVATPIGDRTGTPAVFVGLGDETTGHYDLAFLFDQETGIDRNLRERGALLVGLRSRGVPIGSPTPAFQPWRLDPPLAPVEPAARLPLEPTGEERGTPDADVVLAEWLAPPATDEPLDDDIQLAATWISSTLLIAKETETEEAHAEPVSEPPPAETPQSLARLYESAAVAALNDIFAAMRDRAAGLAPMPVPDLLPPAKDQAAALAELTELANSGQCSPLDVDARAARIVALGDACVRLRALVELRDSGHVTDADLAHRRQTITAQLGVVLEVR